MLSDRGMKDAIRRERLIIDPYDHEPGTCSYDLTTERIHQLKDYVSFQDLPKDESEMERFLDSHSRHYDGILNPQRSYIGVSKEKIRYFGTAIVTTRSSAARLSIETLNAFTNRWHVIGSYYLQPRPIYTRIRSFANVEVPEGSRLSQVEFDPAFYLQGEAFEKALDEMEALQELKLSHKSRKNGKLNAIVLTVGNTINVHNGKLLKWGQNNDSAFNKLDVTNGYELYRDNFCLIPSQEYIHLPSNCAGWLHEFSDEERAFIIDHPTRVVDFMIHPNAPLIAAGSSGNQICEVWHDYYFTYHNGVFDRGMPLYHRLFVKTGYAISLMSLHPLDQEPEMSYGGKYAGQEGPQVSLSQLDN